MPYFKNETVNILFIHIPKTGGTSIEQYFTKKFNIPLDKKSLYSGTETYNSVSYQHQLLRTIMSKENIFNIDYNNLFIFSIVRNPYHRMISELFYYGLIQKDYTQIQVFEVIQKYFHKYILGDKSDNHALPQHYFICDDDYKINEKVVILRTENLTNQMHDLGYNDFESHELSSNVSDYMSYLNSDSIRYINFFYEKDFQIFGYDMIIPTNITEISK